LLPLFVQARDRLRGVPSFPTRRSSDLGRALAAELSERFGLPAFVDNDVNALALGEWMFGAGRGAGSLVVLAPGTSFGAAPRTTRDRKSTRLNSSHVSISYAVFCLKKKM